MKLSIREKKVLYDFACPNHHNTVTRLNFRSCGRTKRAPETGSIYRKMAGLHPVFCGELVTGYPCIPLPGNATKGAFRAGGADRNRISGGSQLLRAGVQRAASPLCWVQGCSALLGSRGKAHWRVEGSQPHLVKGETPCPRRIVALRQFVLGSTCRKVRRFGGFAAAASSGQFRKDWREKN